MSSSENGVFTHRSVKIAYRLILTDSLNEIKLNKEILDIHSNKIKISSIAKKCSGHGRCGHCPSYDPVIYIPELLS